MSHEFNEHRSNKVMRNRVAQITSGYTMGDTVKAAHPSGVKRAAGGAVKGVAQRADGGSVKPRADKVSRAKGGRVKGTTVNVIVSPKDTPAAPPMAAMPPPMPPKPPMPLANPPPAMGPAPGLGGMPPMPPRSDGGRAYKRGGAVKSMKKSKSLKMSGEKHKRASGGAVDGAGVKGKTGIGDRTQIQHSGNKSDTQNIGRKAVITKATGGAIYADGKPGKQMAWLKGVGAGGGEGRLKKAAHAK
jgi:hypothetical protein